MFIKYPEHKLQKVLSESYHIYNYDSVLEKQISNIIDQCIFDLDNNQNLIRLFTDGAFASKRRLPNNILENIDEINLYVTWSNSLDSNCGVCITTYEEESAEHINTHICSNQASGHINKAAIVMYISNDWQLTIKINGNDYFWGIVRHELLHLLHKTLSEDIAEKVGRGFAYAMAMSNYYDMGGVADPTASTEILKTPRKFGPFRLTYILANLFYLMESGEQQAWLQSFNSRDYCFLDQDLSFDYTDAYEYQVYEKLYTLLIKYCKEVSVPWKMVPDYINQLIIDYFKFSKNITLDANYDLTVYIEHYWKPQLEKQLKKMQRIHYENLQKLKK